MKWLDTIPYSILVILSLSLGLAPFVPLPHLFEKMAMLFTRDLVRPVDIFDLVMHGSPVALLIIKFVRGRIALSGGD